MEIQKRSAAKSIDLVKKAIVEAQKNAADLTKINENSKRSV